MESGKPFRRPLVKYTPGYGRSYTPPSQQRRDLIARMTAGPAAAIGRPTGALAVGADADVTIIDPAVRWTIDSAAFKSKSRNCPFHSWQVRGRAVVTIVGGRRSFEL